MFATALAMLAFSHQNVDDAPKWMWETLAPFKAEGLLVGYPEGFHRFSRSRYEAAVATYACIHNVDNLLMEIEKGNRNIDPFWRDGLHAIAPRFNHLAPLSKALTRELDSLGASALETTSLAKGLANREAKLWLRDHPYPNFKDVSSDHWAAEAIAHLRSAGILNGYPHKSFSRR